MNFNEQYDAYRDLVESGLNDAINNLKCNATLKSSIEYSVTAGGKRIRAVMFLAMLDAPSTSQFAPIRISTSPTMRRRNVSVIF
jgi:geranylgeranyl pyrophosphate synthase